MSDARTHRDYVSIIGGTAATAEGWYEQKMNAYYLRSAERIVDTLLDPAAGTVLDVGTSHGVWLPFLRRRGYARVLGVELDPERAEQARRAGYDEIFNTDAADLPLDSESVDHAVSNDVFVHILQLEDKAAVLREVERVLRPGGVFVLNQPMARAFGYAEYTVADHCSFLRLDELLGLIESSTEFEVEDVRPGYYANGSFPTSPIERQLRRRMWLPGAVDALLLIDRLTLPRRALEQSDYAYVKLRKPMTA